MFICVTEVDAATKVPCTLAPMTTGPSMPVLKGLNLDWADMSTWPIEVAPSGKYRRAPRYYGTCDDDAHVNKMGVLEVLSEAEYYQRKYDEMFARKPYPSWTWNGETMTWHCPVPYPEGQSFDKFYWDEESLSWKPFELPTE